MAKLPTGELSELFQKFIYDKIVYESRSNNTVRWFSDCFKAYCRVLSDKFCELKPASIKKENISAYLQEGIIEKNLSKSYILNRYKGLKSFMDWLVKNEHITDNPFDHINRPRADISLPQYLTLDESKQLLNFIAEAKWTYHIEKTRNLAIFATFLYTGVRLSELLNLTQSDVDFGAGTIRVNQGKMGKDRVIPVVGKLKEILMTYYRDRQRLMRHTHRFFVSANRDSHLTINGIYKMFNKLNKESRFNKHLHPHLLRHTAATLVLTGSGDLRAVQAMLGHSTLAMTIRYASCTTEHLAQQMGKNPLSI